MSLVQTQRENRIELVAAAAAPIEEGVAQAEAQQYQLPTISNPYGGEEYHA